MQKCQICGKGFERRPGGNKYCPECGIGTERSRRYERLHPSRCLNCGKAITRRAKLCHLCDNKSRVESNQRGNNPNWKGGRSKLKNGYVTILFKREGKKHPHQLEHIVVWEKANGELPKGWVVHHLNGIRDDNRPENLFGMPRKRHNLKLAFEPYERRIQELGDELRKLK